MGFFFLTISFWLKKNRLNFIIIVTPFILSYLIPTISISYSNHSQLNHKNVFIIGIDSLNTNLLKTEYTPFISEFIKSATYLPNSYTHVARTFPSWMSILSGDYPLTNKARLNLTDFERINVEKSLPYYLKQAGYTNYFSLDERRFSHIDDRLFFDSTIGPPATVGEFIFSKLLDIPLLVITSDLVIFNFFMPQIHNNRAAWQTYSPEKYNEKLKNSIDIDNTPIFLSSHFTLPHWPYKSSHNESNNKDLYDKYLEAVKHVDTQVQDLISFLQANGLLENSILFLLTDHGESFAREEDMPANNFNLVNLAGHGTSIVSKPQFNVLISFKEFKGSFEVSHTGINSNLNYALTDVAPTILDMLGLNPTTTFDGDSVFKVKSQRLLPVESSLKPMFDKSGNLNVSGTVAKNASLFEMNTLGQLVLKESLYPTIMKEKQRGVIYGKWQLSIYPELDNAIFITNLESYKLYNYDSFDNNELKKFLLSKLCTLYAPEIIQSNIIPCLNTKNFLEVS
ncbi:sulfatase-like hydrolase/transferase [Pseudoalteromonas sp. A601]|uniref:sulfatase-like hydrolase/transferase n=1 Tax=Pseudoalteromonas sp. A601 TaxID=1967839 RepID=UPI0015932FE6|nr:sulfatase-like hydrolase/transferase [Pseudoalteromonas sp. A601]